MFTHIENYSVQETRREARAEAIADVARKLLKLGRPISEIIEVTGFSREEIEKLMSAANS